MNGMLKDFEKIIKMQRDILRDMQSLGWTKFSEILPGDKFRANDGFIYTKINDTQGQSETYIQAFAYDESVKRV